MQLIWMVQAESTLCTIIYNTASCCYCCSNSKRFTVSSKSGSQKTKSIQIIIAAGWYAVAVVLQHGPQTEFQLQTKNSQIV